MIIAARPAAGRALGFPAALVRERINAKLCREFYELYSRRREGTRGEDLEDLEVQARTPWRRLSGKH